MPREGQMIRTRTCAGFLRTVRLIDRHVFGTIKCTGTVVANALFVGVWWKLGVRARGYRLALSFLMFSLIPLVDATAHAVIVQIKDRISSEKYEAIRKKIPSLNDIPVDIVRYVEVNGDAIVLRLDDRRYCIGVNCLTFVANRDLTSFVAIRATDTFYLELQTVLLGSDAPESDSGVIYSFQTAPAGSSGTEIKVFVSSKLVVVIPSGAVR